MLAEYSGLVLLLSLGIAWAAGLHFARRGAPPMPSGTEADAPETDAEASVDPAAVAAAAAPSDVDAAPTAPARALALAVAGLVFSVAVLLLGAWVGSFSALDAFGFGAACVFAAPLAVGLAYAWRKGALQW